MSVAGRSVGWASSFCFASRASRRAFITNNFPSIPPCSSPPPPRPRLPRPNPLRPLPMILCQPCRRNFPRSVRRKHSRRTISTTKLTARRTCISPPGSSGCNASVWRSRRRTMSGWNGSSMTWARCRRRSRCSASSAARRLKLWDLTPFAYQTQNSLYFVSGRYYVEAITAMPTEPMMTAMLAMARQFVAAHPPGAAEIPELKLFPPENKKKRGRRLNFREGIPNMR